LETPQQTRYVFFDPVLKQQQSRGKKGETDFCLEFRCERDKKEQTALGFDVIDALESPMTTKTIEIHWERTLVHSEVFSELPHKENIFVLPDSEFEVFLNFIERCYQNNWSSDTLIQNEYKYSFHVDTHGFCRDFRFASLYKCRRWLAGLQKAFVGYRLFFPPIMYFHKRFENFERVAECPFLVDWKKWDGQLQVVLAWKSIKQYLSSARLRKLFPPFSDLINLQARFVSITEKLTKYQMFNEYVLQFSTSLNESLTPPVALSPRIGVCDLYEMEVDEYRYCGPKRELELLLDRLGLNSSKITLFLWPKHFAGLKIVPEKQVVRYSCTLESNPDSYNQLDFSVPFDRFNWEPA
jgi:hypothetical protein